MPAPTTWTCGFCDAVHEGFPFSYGSPAPYYWSDTFADDPASVLEQDQCIVRDEYFFVLGNIRIPVIDSIETFTWSVWVSLSRTSMDRTLDLWETPGREAEPAYFGWLSTELDVAYGGTSTLMLKTDVMTQPVGERPWVHLEHTDHPLAIEQHQGITVARVQQIAELMMHG